MQTWQVWREDGEPAESIRGNDQEVGGKRRDQCREHKRRNSLDYKRKKKYFEKLQEWYDTVNRQAEMLGWLEKGKRSN